MDHTVEYENDITDQLVTTIAKTLQVYIAINGVRHTVLYEDLLMFYCICISQDGTSRGIVIGNTLADVVGNPEMIIEGNSGLMHFDKLLHLYQSHIHLFYILY